MKPSFSYDPAIAKRVVNYGSDTECEMFLKQVLAYSDGIEEETIKAAWLQLEEMRVGAVCVYLWLSGEIVAGVNDEGELVWRTIDG